MAFSTRSTSVAASVVIAAGMVIGAFLFSGARTPAADAASSEALLRAYASKDTDADGLPDWQETLYHTDPENPHSVSPEMTDGEAVAHGLVTARFEADTASADTAGPTQIPGGVNAGPQTLTDRFGRQLLQNYLTTRQSGPLSEADVTEFVASASAQLAKESSFTEFGVKDLTIAPGTDAAAFQRYGWATEEVRKKTEVKVEKDPISYLYDFVLAGDKNALAKVQAVAKAYAGTADLYIKVPVPATAAAAQIRLANAFRAMGVIVGDMGAFDTDPLRGMLGIQRYGEGITELKAAFDEMASAFASVQVRLGVPYDLLSAPTP